MATCPRDGTPIHVDYGMATCPTCGVILFVDMDGEAMLGSQVSVPLGDEIQTPAPPPAPPPEESHAFDPLAALQPLPESEAVAEPAPPEPDAMNMDQFLGYDEAAPEPTLETASETASEQESLSPNVGDSGEVGGPGDPLGISEYANSEFSQAKDGPFLFRLVITGIDSKELREAIREAMLDTRFGWDADELLRNVTKGELHVRNMSPVKATILINRIKRLPVHIRWEQYPVTQAEP
ncbi:MAG: hypothetical protein NDI61_01235 [Bdellovibrionaceae bacterium]|nr:hypothetical protein [Pseudobdellovibrionaceae bacterium]